MGINGLGQLNKTDLQKILASRNGSARVQTASQNINMTRNGSIFNMQRPDQANNTVTAQRTNHFSTGNNKSVENKEDNSYETSVAGGKAAAGYGRKIRYSTDRIKYKTNKLSCK